MNYRDKIRKSIECPQFGSARYGEWGMLNLEQRKSIKRLLDELDSTDNYIAKIYKENQQLKENAGHNDKVVDKVNWENQLLKKENEQLKGSLETHEILLRANVEENQQLKEQQKEFINYLKSMLSSEKDNFSVARVKDVLEKYKEIVGGK